MRVALTPQIQEKQGLVSIDNQNWSNNQSYITSSKMFFFWGGGKESKFCKWDLLQSVKFCLTFLLPDPTPQDVDDEEEDDYIDELFCVACNKAFKSERA